MRRNLTYTLAVFLALLILSTTTSSVLAADYSRVGVKQGDIAWYTVHLTFQPDVVNASVVFYAVTPPTTVSLNETIYFQNGTVYYVFKSTQNLGNGGNLWPILASPGLQKGDPAWIGSEVTINETFTEVFLNQSRVLAYWSRTSGAMSQAYWLDQFSGLLVRLRDSTTGIYNSSWDLMYTTVQLGVAIDPWVIIVLGVTIFVLVVVVSVVVRRRHAHKK